MNKHHIAHWAIRIVLLNLFATSAIVHSATYWVAKDGNDSNPCTNAQPCLSIQKGVHLLEPGDTLNVRAGVYSEQGKFPDGRAISHFEVPAGVALIRSGTPSNPITIQAAPGDEGNVVIDQNYQANGFFFSGSSPYAWPDYIEIKNFILRNCWHSCIGAQDRPGGLASDPDSLVSRGVLIEGNQILSVRSNKTGVNSAAIRMDSSRQWTIRNNLIYGSRYAPDNFQTPTSYDSNAGAIYAYNVFDSIVENNEIRDSFSGIYWKDTANNPPKYPNVQSIIRKNKITNVHVGVYIHAGGAGDTAGYNIVTNNIFENVYAPAQMIGARQAGRINFKHNFVNYGTFGPTGINQNGGIGISASTPTAVTANKALEATGNIFFGSNYRNFSFADIHNQTDALQINYNVYAETVNAYIHGGNAYNSLPAWRNASHAIIKQSPGANSIENQPINSLALDYNQSDYRPPATSSIIGFMHNGDNAGPYQKGNEIIGISLGEPTSTTDAAMPAPPNSFSATVIAVQN